jgi:hypothetical protein
VCRRSGMCRRGSACGRGRDSCGNHDDGDFLGMKSIRSISAGNHGLPTAGFKTNRVAGPRGARTTADGQCFTDNHGLCFTR